MNYEILLPSRAMILLGRMRSGKTCAAMLYAAGISKHKHDPNGPNVLVVVNSDRERTNVLNDLTENGAALSNIKIVSIAAHTFPRLSELHTVVIACDSVHAAGTTIKTWARPSDQFRTFLEKMNDPKMFSPHILATAHAADNIFVEPTE